MSDFYGIETEATGFLILWYNGCLCPWRVSSSQRRRQLNSWFCGTMVAFDLGEFHWEKGGGNWILAFVVRWLPLSEVSFIESKVEATEFLLLWHGGCLWAWWASSSQRRRQLDSCFWRLILNNSPAFRWLRGNPHCYCVYNYILHSPAKWRYCAA